MKLLSLVLFTFLACGAHAQVPADAGLPTTGETAAPPPPPDAPPVQNPKEFNQDIDDFEKKISKEVPPSSAAPSNDKAAEKARAEMKKAHENGGEAPAPAKSGIAAHKEAMAAKKAAAKKAGKSGAAAKKSAKGKAAPKKGAKKAPPKKKKKSADE